MKMCQPHWDAIRKEVERSGLSHLVAKDGRQAMDNMVAEIEGRESDFDPLMAANWAIFSAYLQDVGLGAMVGEVCPLCKVEEHRAGLAENWIKGSVDDQYKYAELHNLLERKN